MKNIFLKAYVLILGVVLASCLEDDKYAVDPEGTQNIIEFIDPSVPASPAGSIYPAYSTSYVLAPEAEYQIIVSYSGANDGNEQAIDLQLAVDPSALYEYNKHMTEGMYGEPGLNGSVYDLMPEENYSIASTSVTIPAGQRKATVSITVFPEKFDFSKNYAIPLKIVSASHGTLSAHYSTAMLAIGVRNIYDGVYEVVGGSITRNSPTGPDPVLGGDYVEDLTQDLVTLASNVLAIEPIWKDGSPVGGVAGTSLTIDEATNEVTVKSSTNPAVKNSLGEENSYDPASKTFTLNFAWGSGASTRVISNLQLRYVSPRP
jgi:hypothetical protein